MGLRYVKKQISEKDNGLRHSSRDGPAQKKLTRIPPYRKFQPLPAQRPPFKPPIQVAHSSRPSNPHSSRPSDPLFIRHSPQIQAFCIPALPNP